jgi:hypothetical protein
VGLGTADTFEFMKRREKQFAVIHSPELKWPSSLEVPSRFRLFVGANLNDVSTKAVSDFALAALDRGIVYFCAWGPGCERFHDIVDEVIVEDGVSKRRFVGPNASDVIMTTWHEDESLEEALDFFVTCAVPTGGFASDSSFRLVITVGNSDWEIAANRFLESAKYFV